MNGLSPFAAFVWAHWQVLLWTSNYAWWGLEAWIFARDLRHARGQSADRFSRVVIVGAIIFGISAASWCMGRFPFARLPDGNSGAIRFASGIACMWIGIAIRLWAVVTLGRYFRTIVMVQEDHRLVTGGLYARVRNPSYSGVLLIMFGDGLTFGNWISLIVCVTSVLLALVFRIRIEERALRQHFGAAYDDYARRSWALIPGVW